ncbi:enoyl-CoA hydratase/isomerase family protein [Nocardia jiangxiensis]|uniref:enoyl-CoA hydratase/isomerase family protein n=1 Tax=Nocardia jiangxiensis TaxID=282685 RepID=UPI00030EAFDE|nr:enoyl-CoA hydratase-related protein [Nocardia jiangxiensis]
MTYDTVRTDVADGVAVLTLDRPDVRNAIDRQVQADVRAALATFRDDPEVGAVVFTGAGDRAFAAGADITQLAVQLAKLVIRTGMDADQRTGLVVERLAQALLYTTDDKREGAQAFLAKRPAAFTGS